MPDNKNLKKIAVEIISDYIGEATGKLYQDFYNNQTDQTILLSLQELLNEYIGESRSKEILTHKGIQLHQ